MCIYVNIVLNKSIKLATSEDIVTKVVETTHITNQSWVYCNMKLYTRIEYIKSRSYNSLYFVDKQFAALYDY